MAGNENVVMDGFLTVPEAVKANGEGARAVRQAIREIEAFWVGFRNGDITAREAFRKIAVGYRGAIAPLAEEGEALNDGVKDMLKTIGVGSGERTIIIPEFNLEFQIRAPQTRVTVDHKEARLVVDELTEMGRSDPRMMALAIRLLDAFKTTPVAGSAAIGKISKKG